jgi:phospholipid-binding lipoprotein MlaA
VGDPFEPMNRSAFQTYLFLDKLAFRPIALTYRNVIPEPIRRSEQNFINNFDSPVIFINDVLRGRMISAGTTLLRATINSTVGVGGLFEVAEHVGLKRHSDDFGKTLAV